MPDFAGNLLCFMEAIFYNKLSLHDV